MPAPRPGTTLAACIVLAVGAVLAGCGTAGRSAGPGSPDSGHASGAATTSAGAAGAGTPGAGTAGAGMAGASAAAPIAHPQAIQPVAGAAAAVSIPAQAGVSVGPPARSLAQPISDTQIRLDLARSGMTANANQASLTPAGLAVAPVNAPAAVQEVIAAGNTIARLPYVWGGGHATYQDSGYDCSGSISYVFAAAHLLDHTVTSGGLQNWGAPGPGKWITVFANSGHTFMYVAGLRFDTVALAETGSRWSSRSATENVASFSVRHPPGL